MRLSNSQIELIKQTVTEMIDDEAIIILFGSRVDDDLRGGDIDLLVLTDKCLPQRLALQLRLAATLIIKMEGIEVDLILQDATVAETPFHQHAKQTGVLL
ncbi:nucleotidyltransferase domain-containing protein [Ectothiorhodospiraceae bacterium BW-2]|nr:nucleotidyltransferase domain-containing protein [Ectothiorhodospiraceae bacterium BW-2]